MSRRSLPRCKPGPPARRSTWLPVGNSIKKLPPVSHWTTPRRASPSSTAPCLSRRTDISNLLTDGLFLDGRIFLLLTDDGSNGDELIAFGQIDDFDPLSVASSLANVFDEGAHHLTARGDDHDFVRIAHGQSAYDPTGFLGGFHRDDALAA